MAWTTQNQKMGFEGQLFYGAPGATATTLLTNTRDITLNREVERGDTTVRGDSSGPPTETKSVIKLMVKIEFTMINDSNDTALEALREAAACGAGVALRGKDYAAGKGPDGDFTLGESEPWTLNGEQVITFTAEPTRGYGRDPVSYAADAPPGP